MAMTGNLTELPFLEVISMLQNRSGVRFARLANRAVRCANAPSPSARSGVRSRRSAVSATLVSTPRVCYAAARAIGLCSAQCEQLCFTPAAHDPFNARGRWPSGYRPPQVPDVKLQNEKHFMGGDSVRCGELADGARAPSPISVADGGGRPLRARAQSTAIATGFITTRCGLETRSSDLAALCSTEHSGRAVQP